MALAAVKTWNPGDTLTAADLNALNTNILNNPISLISPTTGAINFNLQAHTNLPPSAITASSAGSGGSVVITSTGGATAWSPNASAAALFVATTAGIPTWLSVGTSGQVLTATTSGAPGWTTPSSPQSFSTQVVFREDFTRFWTSQFIGGDLVYTPTSGTATFTLVGGAGTGVDFPSVATGTIALAVNTTGSMATPFNTSLNSDLIIRVENQSTSSSIKRFGLTDGVLGVDPTNGLYFRSSGTSTGTYFAVSRNAGVEFTINTSVVASTVAMNSLRISLTGSPVTAVVSANGSAVATFTSSQVNQNVGLGFAIGSSEATTNHIRFDGWQIVQDRAGVM